MKQTQKCFVCGVEGLVVDSEIRISDDSSFEFEPLFIAQCPLCKRFICSKHSERLSQESSRSFLRPKSAIVIAGCPFDPGIPLGVSINSDAILEKLLG